MTNGLWLVGDRPFNAGRGHEDPRAQRSSGVPALSPGGTPPTHARGRHPRSQGWPRLGISRRRSCSLSTLAISSIPASVASDSWKGDDMSLRKRGGIWWIDIRAPNGERIRRTTETANKALAQEFHDRVKSELWRRPQMRAKPADLGN